MTSTNAIIAHWQESFKEIQCYQDDDVNGVIQRLLLDKQFVASIKLLFSSVDEEILGQITQLSNARSIETVQRWVEKNIFPLVANSYDSLSVVGLTDLDPTKSYVFVSNHRDIVMDALLLNRVLRAHNFSTANCAIGDNLLTHPSANDLALLNRCFKVFRSIKSPRAILKAMKTQAAYIQYLRFNKQENIWIAQKEGRAKDNVDKTNPALIKMLGLAKPKHLSTAEYLSELTIVPISFSYEWDPCDVDKARELSALEDNAEYTKEKLDDFIATKKGIEGNKGRIHIHFGQEINALDDDPQVHKLVATKIDQSIKNGYLNYPVNYAAYKKIHGTLKEHEGYTKQEINNAHKMLEKRLENESDDIAKKVYHAYAQTLA